MLIFLRKGQKSYVLNSLSPKFREYLYKASDDINNGINNLRREYSGGANLADIINHVIAYTTVAYKLLFFFLNNNKTILID